MPALSIDNVKVVGAGGCIVIDAVPEQLAEVLFTHTRTNTVRACVLATAIVSEVALLNWGAFPALAQLAPLSTEN